MRNKIILLILTIFFSNFLFSEVDISKKQNKLNDEYLQELDLSLIKTIDLLAVFNETSKKIPETVTGVNIYRKFLMEMTLECSNIRQKIAGSEKKNSMEREILIQMLISSLKPDVQFLPTPIDDKKDSQNKQLLEIMNTRIQKHISVLRKSILDEEKGVLESGTFNKYFLDLHSKHFMYILLLDFLKPVEKLSKENRAYLLIMVREIEDFLIEEKNMEE